MIDQQCWISVECGGPTVKHTFQNYIIMHEYEHAVYGDNAEHCKPDTVLTYIPLLNYGTYTDMKNSHQFNIKN